MFTYSLFIYLSIYYEAAVSSEKLSAPYTHRTGIGVTGTLAYSIVQYVYVRAGSHFGHEPRVVL